MLVFQPLYPTRTICRELLLAGFPFIRREFLRDKPTKIADVAEWANVVRDMLNLGPEPILQDLRRMLQGGAP